MPNDLPRRRRDMDIFPLGGGRHSHCPASIIVSGIVAIYPTTGN